MRVGTISLNINAPDFNYGAMLHSWAFQQYLKQQSNVEYTEIIDYTMPILEGQNLKYPIKEAITGLHLKSLIYHLKNRSMYQSRYRKFERFIKTNICKSGKKYTQATLNVAKLDYDCIICESDVIWAPGFSGGHFDRSFFLALDSMKGMRRIAYAPSMSNGNLNAEQEKELRELLQYPEYISCRESYEKEILEKYTNKPVSHVLDPVLLLDADSYKGICAPKLLKEKYLLLYLPVDDNENLRTYAQRYAKQHSLKILEISTKLKSYEDDQRKCIGDAGIEEFLSAIKCADVVFTNSFHAICFSILFNIEFYAFSRAYAGKVEDICKTFDLENRFFADDNFIEQKPINYMKVNEKYNRLKQQSMEWLEKAMCVWGGKKTKAHSLQV